MADNDRPRLRVKRSWIGNMIRGVIVQGALAAKASVDAIRERIDGPSSPVLAETTNEAERLPVSPNTADSKKRSRQTQSVRNRLFSIRARLPRRSLDHKRRASSDAFVSPGSKADGAQLATPTLMSVAILAASIPLPSSPIAVPRKAPSLSLDLDSSPLRFSAYRTDGFPRRVCTPAAALSSHFISNARDVSPDQIEILVRKQPPVPEARHSQVLEKQEFRVTSIEDGWRLVDIASPLPGANAKMDLDDDAMVKPLRSLPQRSNIPLASTVEQTDEIVCQLTSQDSPSAAFTIDDDTSPTSQHDSPMSEHTGNRGCGPPSPDRSVDLPLRTRASVDDASFHTPILHRVESNSESLRIGFSTGSPRSRKTPRPVSRGRQPRMTPKGPRSSPDLTASILRERGHDLHQSITTLRELTGRESVVTESPSARATAPLGICKDSQQGTSCAASNPQTPDSARHSDIASLPSQRQPQRVDRSSATASSTPSPDKSTTRTDFDRGFRHNDSSSPSSAIDHFYATNHRLSLLTDLDDSDFDSSSDSGLPLFYH